MITSKVSEAIPGTPSVKASAPASAAVTTATLDNGTKVAAREGGNGLATVKIGVAAGAAAESSAEKGSSHLLGITAFAGTASTSGVALIRALDDMGAKVASSADRSKVCYDVTFPSENTAGVLELLGSAVSSAPPAHVYIDAKATAQLAYDAVAGSANAMLGELIFEAAYGEDSAMGNSMYAKTLGAVTPETVAGFRAAHYTAGNVSIAGTSVSVADLTATASAMGLPAGASASASSAFVGGEVRFKADYGNDSNVAIAFPASNAKIASALQTHIVGKTSGLPLTAFMSGGLMGFMASGAPTAVSAAVTAVMTEMKAVAGGASTADAIAAVGISRALTAESACATGDLLDSLLSGEAVTDMSGVTASSVSAATAAALKTGPAYAVLGSVAGTPTLKSIM